MSLRGEYKGPRASLAKARGKKVVDGMIKRFGYKLTNWVLKKRLADHRAKTKLLKKKEELEQELNDINKRI